MPEERAQSRLPRHIHNLDEHHPCCFAMNLWVVEAGVRLRLHALSPAVRWPLPSLPTAHDGRFIVQDPAVHLAEKGEGERDG